MSELVPLFDSKVDILNADSVLHGSLLHESDYDPEWLLRSPPLLDSSAEFLSDVPFPPDIDIKSEIEDVKVEIEDLKEFSDITLRDIGDGGSQEDDFVMPPFDIKQSDSPDNDDADDDEDDISSTSDSSTGRSHFNPTTGLVTPPEEDSFGGSLRGAVVTSSAGIARPAVAVRPLARHTSVGGGGGVSTVEAAATGGGGRPAGIRYLVQRQGNPTVYLQANANGRLRQVVPRLKRQESKASELACTDHFYESAGAADDVNGYMVYPPSPPGSSSPETEPGLVSAAAAAGIYPGHHAYAYSSHLHRSGSHPPPMFQSPIPQSGVLILTEEEKRTLIAEGYTIPTRLPLTKQEERNLKKIRRKIKNKISAQESRRKKKEYVETLEKKVEVFSHENSELKRRVESLESSNRSLLNQLRQLQHVVGKAGASAPSTCLMVLVLFFAAFLAGPASSDLHQMGYAAALPRLPGPPLVPARPPAARGLARFYPPRLPDPARLLVDSAKPGVGRPAEDCSFASRLWCLLGAPCCLPDEAMEEGEVVVVGNATGGPARTMFAVVIRQQQLMNASTV